MAKGTNGWGGAEEGNLIVAFSKSRRAHSSEDFETWLQNPVSPTLNVQDNSSPSTSTVLVSGDHPVLRRLTPRECERLQGLPDDWTTQGDTGSPLSDTARFRMLGNAVSGAMSLWLAENIRNSW